MSPCPECGAVADEPCKVWCMNYDGELIGTPPFAESQGALMASLYRLPFRHFAGELPDRESLDEDQWLAALARWMEVYLALITEQVDKLSADSRRAIGLQIEHDVLARALRGVGR